MDSCPNCGADLTANAKACRECGADEKTGWSAQANYDGLNLPDEEFDHDDFVKREFGEARPIPRGIHWFWWLVAIALIVFFLFAMH